MRRSSALALAALFLAVADAATLGGCAASCPCPEPDRSITVAAATKRDAISRPSAARSRPGRTLTANGVKLWYDVFGSGGGPPLVVINGGPGFNHRYMLTTDVWDRLALHRRVVVYDQRGTGQSDPFRAGGDYTVDAHVADVEALRVALGAEKVDLAGHSWGAFVSMAYAARHPDRVSRLVLCDSAAPRIEDTKILLYEHFPAEMSRFEASTAAVADGGAHAGAEEALAEMLFYAAENRDVFLARNGDMKLDHALNQTVESAATSVDLWPAVRAMRVPTLVLTGRYDANIAPATGWEIHKAIAGSRFYVFEHSGHLPFVEEPDLFVKIVEPFLDGH